MIERIALFEDSTWRQLMPLTLLRPVFELCCGHGSLRERLQRHIQSIEWGVIVRDELAAAYREEKPGVAVNDATWLQQAPALLVNGRWLCDPEQLSTIDAQSVGVVDGVPVCLEVQPREVEQLSGFDWDHAWRMLAASRKPTTVAGTLVRYPWDLVEHNRRQLVSDFQLRVTRPTKADLHTQSAVLGDDEDVFIHPTAEIDPFVVIDARRGPVWVDEGVQVQAFTRLQGPCYIGPNSQLFRANIKSGTTIGPVCRIGGEIEECIFHGYANKYHDGYLGHGYVCPWVNLGALTTNSDLKNDYSPVKVVVSGAALDSGSTKIGCFIGDHTKTAIGSFLNTGTTIGAMSLILPAGELMPKYVPPFSRIWHGDLEALDASGLNAGIATARIAMSRRGMELTPCGEQLLRSAFERTRGEWLAARNRPPSRRIPSPGPENSN